MHFWPGNRTCGVFCRKGLSSIAWIDPNISLRPWGTEGFDQATGSRPFTCHFPSHARAVPHEDHRCQTSKTKQTHLGETFNLCAQWKGSWMLSSVRCVCYLMLLLQLILLSQVPLLVCHLDFAACHLPSSLCECMGWLSFEGNQFTDPSLVRGTQRAAPSTLEVWMERMRCIQNSRNLSVARFWAVVGLDEQGLVNLPSQKAILLHTVIEISYDICYDLVNLTIIPFKFRNDLQHWEKLCRALRHACLVPAKALRALQRVRGGVRTMPTTNRPTPNRKPFDILDVNFVAIGHQDWCKLDSSSRWRVPT